MFLILRRICRATAWMSIGVMGGIAIENGENPLSYIPLSFLVSYDFVSNYIPAFKSNKLAFYEKISRKAEFWGIESPSFHIYLLNKYASEIKSCISASKTNKNNFIFSSTNAYHNILKYFFPFNKFLVSHAFSAFSPATSNQCILPSRSVIDRLHHIVTELDVLCIDEENVRNVYTPLLFALYNLSLSDDFMYMILSSEEYAKSRIEKNQGVGGKFIIFPFSKEKEKKQEKEEKDLKIRNDNRHFNYESEQDKLCEKRKIDMIRLQYLHLLTLAANRLIHCTKVHRINNNNIYYEIPTAKLVKVGNIESLYARASLSNEDKFPSLLLDTNYSNFDYTDEELKEVKGKKYSKRGDGFETIENCKEGKVNITDKLLDYAIRFSRSISKKEEKEGFNFFNLRNKDEKEFNIDRKYINDFFKVVVFEIRRIMNIFNDALVKRQVEKRRKVISSFCLGGIVEEGGCGSFSFLAKNENRNELSATTSRKTLEESVRILFYILKNLNNTCNKHFIELDVWTGDSWKNDVFLHVGEDNQERRRTIKDIVFRESQKSKLITPLQTFPSFFNNRVSDSSFILTSDNSSVWMYNTSLLLLMSIRSNLISLNLSTHNFNIIANNNTSQVNGNLINAEGLDDSNNILALALLKYLNFTFKTPKALSSNTTTILNPSKIRSFPFLSFFFAKDKNKHLYFASFYFISYFISLFALCCFFFYLFKKDSFFIPNNFSSNSLNDLLISYLHATKNFFKFFHLNSLSYFSSKNCKTCINKANTLSNSSKDTSNMCHSSLNNNYLCYSSLSSFLYDNSSVSSLSHYPSPPYSYDFTAISSMSPNISINNSSLENLLTYYNAMYPFSSFSSFNNPSIPNSSSFLGSISSNVSHF